MDGPTIYRFADAEQACRGAAEEFERTGREAMGRSGHFTVALSGGSSPRRMYEMLAEPPLRERLDWSAIDIFWSDERPVPPSHPESNYRMAREALLGRVPLGDGHVHRIEAEAADRDAAARNYAAEIARVFHTSPTAEPPRFDLVLLGMGADGHTASLFPHTASLDEQKHWVVVNRVPQLDTERFTMTVPIINSGHCVLFLVTGAEKAGALAAVLEGPADPQRLPAQLIRPAGRLVFYIDQAAGARLSRVPIEDAAAAGA